MLAAALRLPFLSHQSIWADEVYTRDILGEHTLTAVWSHIKATESTPPLYYVLAWLQGGRSAAAMRLIPALTLVAAVPVAFLALRRLIGQAPAAAAAVLVAVSPELVSYALDARSYGLFVLTALLTVWAFSVVLESGTRKAYALWALACVASIWTHYFAFFLIAAQALVLFALRPRAWRATTATSVAIAVCAAPLLPMLSAQSDNRAGFLTGIPLGTRLEQSVREFGMGANVPRPWLEFLGLAIVGVAVAIGVVWAVRGPEGPRALLAIAAIAFLVPLALSVTGIEDRFDARNVLPVLPLALGLAAPALLRLRGVPLVLYGILALIASLWFATDWRYQNLDYRGALERAEATDPSAPIVTPTQLYEPVAALYLDRPPAASPIRARTAWVLVEPRRGAGQRALHPGPEPSALPGFRRERELSLHGFRIILFTAPQPTTVTPATGYVFAPVTTGSSAP